jgi:hypothetical protein
MKAAALPATSASAPSQAARVSRAQSGASSFVRRRISRNARSGLPVTADSPLRCFSMAWTSPCTGR